MESTTVYSEDKSYYRIINSEDGKRIIKDLIQQSNLLHGVRTDQESLQFIEGKRAMVLYILRHSKIQTIDIGD